MKEYTKYFVVTMKYPDNSECGVANLFYYNLLILKNRIKFTILSVAVFCKDIHRAEHKWSVPL